MPLGPDAWGHALPRPWPPFVQGSLVRVEGLEPPRLAAPEPKSGASTNSATPASFTRPASRSSMIERSLAKPHAGCEWKNHLNFNAVPHKKEATFTNYCHNLV